MVMYRLITTKRMLAPRQFSLLWRRFQRWMVVGVLLVFISYIPVQLITASLLAPKPQLIFTLGGRSAREAFTAEFAKLHPDLPIWISSGMEANLAQQLFQNAGIESHRVNFDDRATDTVTNFTTVVQQFQQQHIRHVYLITSDFHMARASAIATIVFGSRGIRFTPVVVPSFTPDESFAHVLRDVIRSIAWLVTGRTGANLRFHPLFYAIRSL